MRIIKRAKYKFEIQRDYTIKIDGNFWLEARSIKEAFAVIRLISPNYDEALTFKIMKYCQDQL
tara:strand:+ start:3674 stop:3862 length:189 start_codon:yes stop_codon:yes gene_type:complete